MWNSFFTVSAFHIPNKTTTDWICVAMPGILEKQCDWLTVPLQEDATTASHTKTQRKLQDIHSLSIAMLPVLAAKRGFNGRFVKLITKTNSFPALLVLDKTVKENATIISESVPLDMDLHEGDEVTLTSECVKLYAEEISFCLLSHKELCSSVSFIQFLKEQLVCIWQTQVFAESVTESNSIPMKGISFEDIGGYQHELQTLHHQVDMLFSTTVTNVKPVKGILISGPSGCGKSLIGKALKTKYGNKCVSMQLDDVKSKFRGETEQRMKQLFDKALNRSPCLLFIDDLDMLCSSRDKGGDTGIVTALLHLMDGLGTTSEGIIVIATAVKPQTLDAALRRPGRLSYDVMLSSPNEAARRDILQKLLVNVPSDIEETDLATLAANAHGYTGGDLRSIVMEAVMQAEGKRLTKQDLEASLVAIKPAALRDSTTVQKQVKLSDICGHDVIKSKLHESLSLTLAHGPVFQKCSISPPSRFLLFGPPGCGKSFIIMALATEFHLNVISVKRSTVLGKYFGESEQNLANIFMQVIFKLIFGALIKFFCNFNVENIMVMSQHLYSRKSLLRILLVCRKKIISILFLPSFHYVISNTKCCAYFLTFGIILILICCS
nr:uncharacterized protein LOC128687861 [Cherax quadricarinatus]